MPKKGHVFYGCRLNLGFALVTEPHSPASTPHQKGAVADDLEDVARGAGLSALWDPPSARAPDSETVDQGLGHYQESGHEQESDHEQESGHEQESDHDPGPDHDREMPSGRPHPDAEEEALALFADVSEEDLRRARRVRERMEHPGSLGEVLVELGTLTQETLDAALDRRRAQTPVVELLREAGHLSDPEFEVYQQAKAIDPAPSDREVLVQGGLVSEEHYLRAVGARLAIPFVEPQIGEVDTDLIDKIPFAYLMKNLVLPIREEDGQVVIVVARPEDDRLVVEVESTFGMRAVRQCSTSFRIVEALRTLERIKGNPSDRDAFKIQYRELDQSESTDSSGEEAVQLVDYLLTRAIQLEASDLHIEPQLGKISVRVRVDGVLHHLTDIPVDFTSRLVARIKILARADVTEKRLHQDGKIHVKVDGRAIDIRVSTYVSMFGETIVMRLLDRDRSIVPLEEIGFQPRVKATLADSVLRASSGMVLLVGPTGSGKTTTLYSFVDHANDPTEKVISCEDPVEYVIEGIVQCSVNSKTGPTFGDSLRAIVRQDPDTIVVGEIRDQETAKLAVEAALTGHKVYSTFHTEEAVGAFIRLLEMGIEPFLVASTISAVIAQRLVRRLCTGCKVPTSPKLAELRFLGADRADFDGAALARRVGCKACNGTGFTGRLAIHEVLVPTDEFRQAVLECGSSTELRELARALPEFLTMQEDGLMKAIDGITTLEEIIENAPRDTAPRRVPELRRIANSRRAS